MGIPFKGPLESTTLLLVAIVAPLRLLPRSIVSIPTGLIAEYFECINDLVEGSRGFFGRYVLVLVGVRVECLFSVRLFDLLNRSGPFDSQDFVQIGCFCCCGIGYIDPEEGTILQIPIIIIGTSSSIAIVKAGKKEKEEGDCYNGQHRYVDRSRRVRKFSIHL